MYPDELSTNSSTSANTSAQWDGYSDASFISSIPATPSSTHSTVPRAVKHNPTDEDDSLR
jgi:hypothetical protein